MTKTLLICYTILSVAFSLQAQSTDFRIEIDYNGNSIDTKFISRDSLILITGFQSTVSLLINTNDKSVKAIDPRVDFPGFNFLAVEAQFYKDRILYTNAGPWGFTISLQNKDVKELDRFFLAPPEILSIPNRDYFFGFQSREPTLFPDPILVKYNYNGITLDTTHYYDFRLPNILTTFDAFNLLYLDNNFVFSNPLDNELLLFDTDGNYKKTIQLEYKRWNAVISDTKTIGDSPTMFKKFNDSNATFLRKLYKLNNSNDILVQYSHRKSKQYTYCIFEGSSYRNKICFDLDITREIIGTINNQLFYFEHENDKTYLVGKDISTFIDI